MAGSASGGVSPGRLTVAQVEGWVRVTGRRLELGGERERARIGLQRLDRLDLGRVHVALGAEVARVAGRARGGDLAFAGAGLLAMALLDEARRAVRSRRGEARDVGAGQADRPHQRHVAGDARAVGRFQVLGLHPVAVETVPHHRQLHLHRVGAGLGVTRPALQGGIGLGPTDRLGVAPVGEREIAGAWPRRGCPVHRLLDRAVVALGAVHRRRPQGGAGLRRAGVAARAGREERAMLPMVEVLLRHPGQR